jgi:hypothetical protein
MHIVVVQPTGIAPKITPAQLRDNAAQVATNCRFDQADVRPLRDVSVLRANWGAPHVSIYRFGQDVSDPALYWFRSSADVSYQRAPFYGDTRELTFLTESGKLKYTTNTVALAGEPYPTVTYDIPDRPSGTMAANVTGTGSGTAVSYVYVMTTVTSEGFMSRPSAATSVTAQSGQAVTLTQLAFPSGPYSFGPGAKKQLWRSTASGTFELRSEKSSADSTDFVDVVDSASMGDVLDEPWNLTPPANAHSLVAMSGFFLMVAAGRDLYPSKIAPNVHAYPEDYRVLVHGTDPGALKPIPFQAFRHACVSRRSVVALNLNDTRGGVVYAAADGLCWVGAEGPQLATKNIFTREQWQAYNPTSIHGYAWNGKYVGFYDAGGGVRGGFIFDPTDERRPFAPVSIYATAGYSEPLTGRLHLQVDDDLVTWDAGSYLTATWRSKKYDLGRNTNLGCARVQASSYTGLTFRLIGDGATLLTHTVTDGEPFRLPSDTEYRVVEFEISGQGQWHRVDLAHSLQELGNV